MEQSSVNSHQPQHHCTSSPAPLHLEYAPMPYAPPTILSMHTCTSVSLQLTLHIICTYSAAPPPHSAPLHTSCLQPAPPPGHTIFMMMLCELTP